MTRGMARRLPCLRLESPDRVREPLLQLVHDQTQRRRIVGRAVFAHRAPVHSLRRKVRRTLRHLPVPALRLHKPLRHELDPPEAHPEPDPEFAAGKIAFQAPHLDRPRRQDEDGRSPADVEAAEQAGLLVDIHSKRNEMPVDEIGSLVVPIRLGLQPNAAASSRRGAEVEEGRLLRFRRLAQGRIDAISPVDLHIPS